MTDAKQKILDASSELFLNGGISALSVRAIAAKAGVSTIGIYSHFNGKQGILDALYINGFKLVSDAMSVDTEGLEPREFLLEGIKGYLQLAEEHEAHYRLIFGESDKTYQPSPEAKEAAEDAFMVLVRGCSSLLPANASLKQQRELALEIWAHVHGFVSLKHHAVSSVMDKEQWNKLAVKALTTHIEALQTQLAL